jgi:GAF domain-containing protein
MADDGGKAMSTTDGQPDTGTDPIADITGDLSETTRILFSAGSVMDTLSGVVALAVSTIEGCDFAGLFLLEGDDVTTPVHTDPIVDEIDALQHESGGPCLDAIAQRMMFYANDLSEDTRWGEFGTLAAAAGIRSALSLPLTTNGTLGALNLYARYPAAFGSVDRARGAILASLAAIALSAAHSHEDEERKSGNLHAALTTREIIGQAQGILMERERITSDEAFDFLRRASQHLNVKLREVARVLVETGERPETGESPEP